MCGSGPSTTTITITFSATKDNPFPPTISDGVHSSNTGPGDTAFVTSVKRGNNVVFKKDGDISSFTCLKATSGNVFSDPPAPQPNGSWQGVIGNFGDNTEESYSITYVVNGTSYTQDPKLQINP